MKRILRKILGVKENETIKDAIFRYKVNISKLFYRKKYNINDFKKILISLGINIDDNVMIHSSWRSLYNYNGTPKEMIDSIISLIGKNGTISMPCYGNNRYVFDVDNDKSAAGVLSETLRKYPGSIRSRGAHFSCVSYGKNAKNISNEHPMSKYGFDSKSPYYKFVELDNSKIIMIGLGKNPVKLSLYHLVEMIHYNYEFYNKLFQKKYSCVVKYRDGKRIIEKEYNDLFQRENTVPNKKNINKIYKQSFCLHKKISNVDIYVLDAKKALDFIIDQSKNNHHMIKVKSI